MQRFGLPCSLLLLLTTVACSRSPHPETLEDLVTEISQARADGDQARLAELVGPMIPTHADVRRVFARDSIGVQFRRACRYVDATINGPLGSYLADQIFRPTCDDQTEVRCHSATTEELRKWETGSLAWREFPAEARRFAQVANPDLTWWVVEQAAPDRASGHRTALITRLDDRFVLLPEPWRWLKRL